MQIQQTDALGVQLLLGNPDVIVHHIIPAKFRSNYNDLTSITAYRWDVVISEKDK